MMLVVGFGIKQPLYLYVEPRMVERGHAPSPNYEEQVGEHVPRD
eukprot:CAMPEP_0184296842 /NCGR_PEP_ID=MMETSP1049-20130417/7801_1 /TAXON_ID=77928 /ORGANISM="Proteomonas sulcata, Strain CCMP704" /LENGTH=43 /DNA_ID= /DNA_START= /DNA_END= /DNA_ORIENTATION=